MAEKDFKDKDILFLGHLKKAFALLDRLHEVGCERDSAGNRQLHFDQYCKLVLLYIWNPLIASMHDLQEVLALPKVAKALGIKRFSAGSFSESVRVFDPEQLKPIVKELAGGLVAYPDDPRLSDLKHTLTLVDGTVLTALSQLAKAACPETRRQTRYNTSRDGQAVHAWKLHTQFDLATFIPHRMDRTGARNGGDNRESHVLRSNLESGRCYVADGAYADRTLFNEISAAQSSYVIRMPSNSVCEVIEERELSQEALDAGIVRDALVRLDGAHHIVRRVEVQIEPHPHRKRDGTKKIVDLIILCTNLLDLPVELVALIYRYRYTVELFFRIFKQLLGMRHLLSQREEGIDIQIYCTLMVCVLIQRMTGKKPNKSMRNMIGWYLLGLAEAEDVIRFLNKPDNTGVKLRAKEDLMKKLGF